MSNTITPSEGTNVRPRNTQQQENTSINIDQVKAREVCELWKNCSRRITNPNVKVIGVKAWKKYLGFEIEGEVPPPLTRLVQTVKSLRDRIKGEKEAPTCTAILMPKRLTANKLIELMKNPKKGSNTKLDYIWDGIIAELGDKEIEESYWLVITDDVIEGSRGKTYEDQKKHVQEKTDAECELPTYLEALACCVMHHVIYGEHLLGRERRTFTRCQDLINGKYPVVVGGSGGLHVGSSNSAFADDSNGVAACWKFY